MKRAKSPLDIGIIASGAILFVLIAALICSAFGIWIPSLLGMKCFVVASGSMEPALPVGSMLYVEPVPFEDIREQDVITFALQNGQYATQRVVAVDRQAEMLYTRGDANGTADENPVLYEDVVGRRRFHISGLGFLYADYNRFCFASMGFSVAAGCVLVALAILRVDGKKPPANEARTQARLGDRRKEYYQMSDIKRYVYADNAATTKISDKVLDAMLPWLREGYGNPSSIYAKGREALAAIETARERVAAAIGAVPRDIYFTSGGSESDNWAIKCAVRPLAKKGKKHIITSAFEHHAVLHAVQALKKEGFEVDYVEVNADGVIKVEDVAALVREDTALVSIIYANNEIGTVQPIAEIGALCRERGVLFHTDAVQAVGNVPIDVEAQSIDMLSLSGHKLHAQKGVGALYVCRGILLPNLIDGGGQERGKRAGTENVAGIVGLGVAIEEACGQIAGKAARLVPLRDRLIDGILKLPRTRLNGSREKRLPGNVNISFEGIEGESLLLMLDMRGIAASSGSACTSGSLDPSHVLLAIGLPHEVAHGSLRLSLGEDATDADVDYILGCLPPVIERLRGMSPLWESILKQAENT